MGRAANFALAGLAALAMLVGACQSQPAPSGPAASSSSACSYLTAQEYALALDEARVAQQAGYSKSDYLQEYIGICQEQYTVTEDACIECASAVAEVVW